MTDWFGLGIALELRDQMSQGLQNAQNNFNNFTDTLRQGVGNVDQEINRLNNLQITGALMSGTGSMISGMGASLLNPVITLGKEVVNTSSQFEQWRMTLKALYKDADLANEKLMWGMDLATKTPFEMTDVTQALIGFKAVGAEADTMFTNANGQARSFLEYMGDLAALRPDVGLQGVMLGVRNLLGGDGGKSLKMRMDIDLEGILGRDFGSTTEEIMQDLVTISDKLAGGLMNELEGTWSQIISNLKDQSTRLFLAIGDSGAFDMFKKSLQGIADIINSIDDERMSKIGSNIAEALGFIWKPVQFVIKGFEALLKVFIKLAESDSIFAKITLGVMSFVGVGLLATGTVLKLSGGFLQTISSLGIFLLMMSNSGIHFTSIIGGLKTILARILPLVAVLGTLAVAWKTDFLGIRTTLTNFTNTIKKAWTDSTRISRLGVSDMLAELDKLDTKTFGGWLTYQLVKIKVFWEALCEAWNTNTLSDETFQKVQELGLLPLLSTILDIKQRAESFFDGFKKGWENVSTVVSTVVSTIGEWIGKLISWLFPVEESVGGVADTVGGINTKGWEKFGEVTAYIVSFLGGLLVVTKIIGIISWVGGAIAKVWGVITSVISGIGTIIGGIGTALSFIGGIVTTILAIFGVVVSLPPALVGAIVVAIGALIGIIIAFWDEIVAGAKWCWDKIVEGWNWLVDKTKEIFSSIGEFFSGIWEDVKQITSDVWDSIIDFFTPVINFFKGLGQMIFGIFQIAWNLVKGIVTGVVSAIILVVGLMIEGIKKIVTPIIDFFKMVWQGILDTVKWVYDLVVSIWGKAVEFFTTLWNNIYDNIIKPVWDKIIEVIQYVYDTAISIWTTITDFFSNLWQGVCDIVSNIWNTIQTIINTVFDVVSTIWSAITGFFSDIWTGISNTVSEIWGSISGIITGVYDVVSEAWGKITGVFSGIWDNIKGTASTFFDWLGGKFGWVADLIDGVTGVFSNIGDGISSGVSNLIGGFKKMVGLNTGGYVKTEGVAMLHPNEVVVNDELTQQLRAFLQAPEESLTQTRELPQKKELPQERGSTPSVLNGASQPSQNVSNDNSVVFSEGAIQVNVQNASPDEANKLAKLIMEKIKRETQLRSTLNYNIV